MSGCDRVLWSITVVCLWCVSSVCGCARQRFVPGPWMSVWPPAEERVVITDGGEVTTAGHEERNVVRGSGGSSAPVHRRLDGVQNENSLEAIGEQMADGTAGRQRTSLVTTDGSPRRPVEDTWQTDQRLTDEQKQVFTRQVAAMQARGQGVHQGPQREKHLTASPSATSVLAPSSSQPSGAIATGEDRQGRQIRAVESQAEGVAPEVPAATSAISSTDVTPNTERKTPSDPMPPGGLTTGSATTGAASATGQAGQQTAPPDSDQPTTGQWRQELQRVIDGVRRELQDTAGMSDSERWRLEAALRLLYVVAERREDSVRNIAGLDTDTAEFWKLATAGLYELLDPRGSPVADRRNKLALRYLREAVHHLAAASSLDVRNLAICRRVDSFGQYTEFEPYVFKPEQEVILYVEVGNFAAERTPDGYETEFQGSYQILDASGRRIADYDLPIDKQTCRNLRTDYFLPYRIFLPKSLSPGSYQIQVTIEDKKGKKFGQTPPVAFSIRS